MWAGGRGRGVVAAKHGRFVADVRVRCVGFHFLAGIRLSQSVCSKLLLLQELYSKMLLLLELCLKLSLLQI